MRKILLILFSVGCIVPVPLSYASFTPTAQQLSSIVQIFSQQKLTPSNTYENIQWGSGYFISSDGTLLTNAHVVLSEKTYQPYDRYMICMTVSTNVPECTYTASLIVSDADNDIALLRLDNKDISGNIVTTSIQPISWGDSSTLSIGQEIGILGYPEVGDKTITQTRGIVSGFLYNTNSAPSSIEWIKTDAKVSEGNSGGAGFDTNGHVIGMPNYVMTGTENIGLLRPANFIRNWKDGIMSKISGKSPPVVIKKIPDDINDLNATAGDQTVSLSWSAPFSSDGIDHYEIIYDTAPVDADNSNVNATDLPHYCTTDTTEINIPNLSNDTEYYFYVRAVTTTGQVGAYWSNEAYATPSINTSPTFSSLFKDMTSDHPNYLALSYLKDNGALTGYRDGYFRPDKLINRAELMKILVEGKNVDTDPTIYKNCYPDVHEEWYAQYVCYAQQQGWVNGYPDKTFKPDQFVNRVESLKMILNAYGLPTTLGNNKSHFTDVAQNSWYLPYVSAAEQVQLLEETGTLSPDRFVTRANVSENIYRAALMEKVAIPTTTAIWQTTTGQPISISTYFPLAVGKEWHYGASLTAQDETSSMKISGTCSDLPNCFVVENNDFTYQYAQEENRIVGLDVVVNTNKNANFPYDFPETIFTNHNTINYFRMKKPAILSITGGGTVTVFDGINLIEGEGSEMIDTIMGEREALKVHSIDLVRINNGTSAFPYDLSNETWLRSESTKYFVPNIGLVKYTNTLTLGKDQTSSPNTEELISYQ